MSFSVGFTEAAVAQIRELKETPHLQKRLKAVFKALEFLEQNPRHPGLRTHVHSGLKGPKGEKVFEAYAEQNTPAAYRIFFYYGKAKGDIIVLAVTPHP